MSLAPLVLRWRWGLLAAWAAGAVALWLAIAPVDPAKNEPQSLLPDWTPYRRAVAALKESFPHSSGLSQAVVVFERRGGRLTPDDRDAVERVAGRILPPETDRAGREDLAGINVRSPRSIPLPRNPLVSGHGERGQAALIVINVPSHFVSIRSARVVRHVRAILAAETLPHGLKAEVTGSAAFGNDYAVAGQRSHERALRVTLAAVIVILVLVYRAPLAALVPLTAISLAAAAAVKLLDAGQHVGMHIGTAEHIFVIVLLYGAGTDYSLMLISRYRELLAGGGPGRQAAVRALARTGPAILASAATDIIGLFMLCAADFKIFRSTGPAVAIGLGAALLAAVTLVPAMLGILGPRMFWPWRRTTAHAPGRAEGRPPRVWPKVARMVTSRPATVLAVTLLVLGPAVVQGAHVPWVYDTLTDLGEDYGSVRGAKIAQRHWGAGQIGPVTVLLRSGRPVDTAKWRTACRRLTQALGAAEGVRDVRSLAAPLGLDAAGDRSTVQKLLAKLPFSLEGMVRKGAEAEYLSADRRASRLVVVLDRPAFTLEAMAAARKVRSLAAARIANEGIDAKVHLAGPTAQMMDTRNVTQRDFYRVAVLAIGAVFVIILLLLRDVILSLFMAAGTIISYLATLGVSYWVFAGLFGDPGLDWKVEVFLFVVMVAVGVDYSIFLAARIAEEACRLPARLAIRVAVTHTGPVISSCGVIMAATLGSLMAGDFKLLHQLGFALALGMLLDTFVTRPLVLPAFAALTRRTGRAFATRRQQDAEPDRPADRPRARTDRDYLAD